MKVWLRAITTFVVQERTKLRMAVIIWCTGFHCYFISHFVPIGNNSGWSSCGHQHARFNAHLWMLMLACMLDWCVAKHGKINTSAKNGRCPHLKTEPFVRALGEFGHPWSEAITGHVVWKGQVLRQPLLLMFKGELFPSCWFWFTFS